MNYCKWITADRSKRLKDSALILHGLFSLMISMLTRLYRVMCWLEAYDNDSVLKAQKKYITAIIHTATVNALNCSRLSNLRQR